jgi:hypothetical protein
LSPDGPGLVSAWSGRKLPGYRPQQRDCRILVVPAPLAALPCPASAAFLLIEEMDALAGVEKARVAPARRRQRVEG